MKKLIFIAFFTFLVTTLFGQIQGLSYQAVVIDQNSQELPGIDASGVILPNKAIKVRFTILDAAGTVDYQEEHETTTDAFGIINLTIGQGKVSPSSPKTFKEIDWDGNPKNLKVDISVSQTDVFYTDFSNQELTFIPYAYHKNITATGTLKVDGKSTLQDLSVNATTNLNGSLDVNNGSPTSLSGALQVKKGTVLGDTLTVNSASNLNGMVVVTASISGNDDQSASYPLYVKGSNQGIAIKVNGSRNNSNNFVTFWDDEGIQGRIEGQSTADITNGFDMYYENVKLVTELAMASAELVAASTSSTPCVGLGACVTAPSASEIAFGVAQVAIATANIAYYNAEVFGNAGVAYESKGADYAEYLPKANPAEKFNPGDIVGIKNGKVSRSVKDADKIMIVSRKPIVVGNIPDTGKEEAYVKIAFIGQVETKVLGKVNPGDYIIPSGKNDGAGIAVSPENLNTEDYFKIAGIAWGSSQKDYYSYVNTAVGINTTDIARISGKQEKRIREQEDEIQSLKAQLDKMNAVLSQLVPQYKEQMNSGSESRETASVVVKTKAVEDVAPINSEDEPTIFYYKISKDQIDEGLKKAKEILEKRGTLHNYPVFQKLDSDMVFRTNYVNELLKTINNKVEENYNRDMKAGKKVVRNF